MIEKEFLENVDYLMDLSDRVKKSKKISPKLLSEIVCAKSYIDSLSVKSADKYRLSEVSNMFDIVISGSKELSCKNFDNPCVAENKKYQILENIVDIISVIIDFIGLVLDSPIVFVIVPVAILALVLLIFGNSTIIM